MDACGFEADMPNRSLVLCDVVGLVVLLLTDTSINRKHLDSPPISDGNYRRCFGLAGLAKWKSITGEVP
jgi:hypothetical protein